MTAMHTYIERKRTPLDIHRLRSILTNDLQRLSFVRGCSIEPIVIINIQLDIHLLGGMAGEW